MNIRFKNIDIESFRSIDRATISLENQGTVIVKGINEYEDKATSNGSGKSSVFEAIIYALFEETSSGEKDVANRIKNDGFTIKLDFDINGDSYQILRQNKSNKSSVVIYKNGNDISARNKTDTNKLIAQILGISKSIFLDSVFLSQNANTNLASLTPTARKERLEILTNTDSVVNNFKDKLKDKQTEYEAECVNAQLDMNKLNGSIETNKKQQQDLQFKIDEINKEIERLKQLGDLDKLDNEIKYKEEVEMLDLNNLLNKLTEFIENKEKEVEELRKLGEDNLSKKDELEKQKQDKLNEWNNLDKSVQEKQSNIKFAEQDNKRIDKEIEKIKNSDRCPTCGRKYEDANEEHIQQAIKELEDGKSENSSRIEQLQSEILEIQTQKSNVENEGRELANKLSEVNSLIEEHKKQVMDKDDQT